MGFVNSYMAVTANGNNPFSWMKQKNWPCI